MARVHYIHLYFDQSIKIIEIFQARARLVQRFTKETHNSFIRIRIFWGTLVNIHYISADVVRIGSITSEDIQAKINIHSVNFQSVVS